MTIYLSIVGGLVLLGFGADLLVRGAVSLARSAGLSPLLIGLTLVGFGTSTPELVTSVSAALDQSPGIALGNVLGSNIANILLVLGVAALIAPLRIDPRSFGRDAAWLAGSTLVMVSVVWAGGVGRVAGVLMTAAVIAYVLDAWRLESRDESVSSRAARTMGDAAVAWPSRRLPAAAITIAGIVGTMLGARLLVDGSIGLARQLDVPETVIGLTIVAVGTSLPEMTTSLVAAWRRQPEIAYGNVIGSNIFNALFVLGASALVAPFDVPPEFGAPILWLLTAATALLIFFGWTGFRLNRIEASIFVAVYVSYVTYLIIAAG